MTTWFREESARTLGAAAGDDVYVFSPNCYHHGLAYDDIFWTVTVGEWTAASMLAAIFEGGAPPPPRFVLDDCDGQPCSPKTRGDEDCVPVPPPAARF